MCALHDCVTLRVTVGAYVCSEYVGNISFNSRQQQRENKQRECEGSKREARHIKGCEVGEELPVIAHLLSIYMYVWRGHMYA